MIYLKFFFFNVKLVSFSLFVFFLNFLSYSIFCKSPFDFIRLSQKFVKNSVGKYDESIRCVRQIGLWIQPLRHK